MPSLRIAETKHVLNPVAVFSPKKCGPRTNGLAMSHHTEHYRRVKPLVPQRPDLFLHVIFGDVPRSSINAKRPISIVIILDKKCIVFFNKE